MEFSTVKSSLDISDHYIEVATIAQAIKAGGFPAEWPHKQSIMSLEMQCTLSCIVWLGGEKSNSSQVENSEEENGTGER